jgi:hypothetical protein
MNTTTTWSGRGTYPAAPAVDAWTIATAVASSDAIQAASVNLQRDLGRGILMAGRLFLIRSPVAGIPAVHHENPS